MSVKKRGCKTVLKMPTYTKLVCENITVIRPPLLKVYYWESFQIDELNKKLDQDNQQLIEHTFKFPVCLLNSEQLKVIFWLRNISDKKLEMHTKRVKRCDCIMKETKVGFNQFTELYHCPHRRLLSIAQNIIRLNAHELAALSVTSSYFLYGAHELTYDICCCDNRVIRLNFHLNVTHIEPSNFVLTKSLIPMEIKEYRRTTQPIWIHNLSVVNISLRFRAKTRGFVIVNSSLELKKNSILPLLIKYRPSCYEETISLHSTYDKLTEKINITGGAVTEKTMEAVETYVPEDYLCDGNPYIIFPNKTEFKLEMNQERSKLVILHNYSQNCMEFRWEPFIMNGLFEVNFAPESFRLKGHHEKLIAVVVKTFNKPFNFKRIPLKLNVHRIEDHNTRIAKGLINEFDISLDDPKVLRDTCVQHIFLEMSVKVNLQPLPFETIEWDAADRKFDKPLEYPTKVTLVEKFFGQKLAETNFMRPRVKHHLPTGLSYSEMLCYTSNPHELPEIPELVDKWKLHKIFSELLYEAVDDLSKFWYYIPPVYASDEVLEENV